ncbi:hypothetical protein L195_g008399 [Trifolium pratense]|uniref:Uncharacterized protein n=1 Tax=Trifolium pratense TaxID=57577 RepID=A0A2K3P931_TRIPR|nr:hypothetical protein L195_g008399 [Trifolium pratense]
MKIKNLNFVKTSFINDVAQYGFSASACSVGTSVGAGAGASLGAGAGASLGAGTRAGGRVGARAGVRVGVTKSFDSFEYRRCFRSLPYTTQKIKENITAKETINNPA